MGTVIVLGHRPGLAEAIERRGLEPLYVVEKDKEALRGRRVRRVSDLENGQEVLRAVMSTEAVGVAGVVTAHEQGVFTAALLRDHLRLPGDRDYARALRFRDKYLQKTALPPSVGRAACVYVDTRTGWADLADRLGVPFVVKPANGFAAAGAAKVCSEEEFDRYLGEQRRDAAVGDTALVAESFVPGDELHVDGVWYGGRMLWSSVARYHEPPMNTHDGAVLASQILSPTENPDLVARAGDLAAEALRGLDAPDCVFHLEAFDSEGTLVFGECAARLSGAHLPEIVGLTYGVNLYDAVVALAVGEDPSPHLVAKEPTEYFAYVYLRRFPGTTVTRADFEKRFRCHELSYQDGGVGRTGYYGRVGHALVGAPTNSGLTDIVDRMVEFNAHGRDREG
ncbi:ATP-grasp domain-containing protein [Streptomyces spongiae]|uniref:ATP-grasp domain-containing protein n=1 Tax=Streptomyces spongiae TaxID=565072 RepID=A0A5N8XS34_9ACTN|nr:ATP-grasp domain-containing protein [Streptomyces spongiae]MPY61996.1 ATP-grasp domain-containing protein [Streptomyces spongiae]